MSADNPAWQCWSAYRARRRIYSEDLRRSVPPLRAALIVSSRTRSRCLSGVNCRIHLHKNGAGRAWFSARGRGGSGRVSMNRYFSPRLLDYSSWSSHGGIRSLDAPGPCLPACNVIGYASVVVRLFAAASYVRVPAIKRNRKTWMECRSAERQYLPAVALATCYTSLSLSRYSRRVIETFFFNPRPHARRPDCSIQVTTFRNLLISCSRDFGK